jgi:hypothetical protein
MNGIHEVRGSIPLGSTNIIKKFWASELDALNRLAHPQITHIGSKAIYLLSFLSSL